VSRFTGEINMNNRMWFWQELFSGLSTVLRGLSEIAGAIRWLQRDEEA
jgi:hypothetical protein